MGSALPRIALGALAVAGTLCLAASPAHAQHPVPVPAPATNGGSAEGTPATPVQERVGGGPQIHALDPNADLGEILQGESRRHTFVLENSGDQDLRVMRVQPSCGCTVAQVTSPDGTKVDPRTVAIGSDLFVVAPGERFEVEAEYNSAGQPVQSFEKHLTVVTSDDRQPNLMLNFRGTVIQGVLVDPNPLQFGDVVRGEDKTMRALARLVKTPELQVTGISEKPDYLDVTYEKVTTEQGMEAIAFDVRLKPDAPLGYITPVIVATTDHPRIDHIRLQVYANVKSDLVFDSGNALAPERIDFEVIPFGTSVSRTLDIKAGNAKEPFHLKGVEVESRWKDFFDVETETIEEGRHVRIRLTTDPELDARFFRGNLKVLSDHRDVPEKLISFHGWVKKD